MLTALQRCPIEAIWILEAAGEYVGTFVLCCSPNQLIVCAPPQGSIALHWTRTSHAPQSPSQSSCAVRTETLLLCTQ